MTLSAHTVEGWPIAVLAAPGLLYAGLAAAAVPILIHLLNRRRFRRVRWAAVEFLLQADRENRRRIRIEEMTLLALRCVAMGLLGLVLARWFLRPESLIAALGARGQVERIVVVDDSFSMGVRENGTAGDAAAAGPAATLFDQARSILGQLVRTWQDSSPDDSLTLLLSSKPDAPIEAADRVGGLDAAWKKNLDALAVSNRAGNWPATMTAVRQRLDGLPAGTNAVLYILSDFQRIDWVGPDRSGSPAAALTGWADGNRSLRIVLVALGGREADNLAIVDVEPQQAQAVATIDSRFSIRITNFGARPSTTTNLLTYVGDAALPPVSVPAIEPGRTVEVATEVTFPSEGTDILTVELPPDRLPVDNTRRAVVPVARSLRVLMVNGEKSGNPYDDEVFLLTVALQSQGPQFSGNEVTAIEDNDLESADLSEYHAVVLANVYRITETAAERLESYVADGGGLAVFLGDQVDSELYNRLLFRDGRGLLPGRLGERIACPADAPGWGLVDIRADHPLTRRLADAKGLLQPVRVRQCVRCQLDRMGDTRPTADVTTQPTSRPTWPARTPIQLNNEDKDPLLIERAFGKGRVLLFPSSADKEWNNLPDHPAFVVLAMEAVQFLARGPSGDGQQLVGRPIRRPIDGERFQPTAWLKPPSFPAQPALRLDPQLEPGTAEAWLTWPHTDEPGIYRLERTDSAGKTVSIPIVVNVDPRESDLRRADEAALREAAIGLDFDYVTSRDLVGLWEEQVRRELWPALLTLLAAVLMVEQFLGWYFGCGRNLSLLWRGGKA
ncbi:MAG TPA: BatA domain-containing protein [Phycisphaerae bacterium]|nr:BatA domain-containing protein [Phycisphaerae bacterium]